jgi:hypothetical protein
MQRSPLLNVTVHCPHFDRPVQAQRNVTIDRLCACNDSELCRDGRILAGGPSTIVDDSTPPPAGEHARPFPHGCPVFPQLAK